jgi:hypothetical protein
MTAPDVSLDELRRSVVDGLQRTVDRLAGGYAAPLRTQLRAEDDVYDPAVLCLGFGRICGEETKTLPCALTLGLLEEMGRVFLGLEDGSAVLEGWGMPRTLNAADGLYTLGRQTLISHEVLDTEALRKAARSLYPAAASFAALCCGLGDAAKEDLVAAATAGSVETALVKASSMPLRQA